jgi:hypothetical protein
MRLGYLAVGFFSMAICGCGDKKEENEVILQASARPKPSGSLRQIEKTHRKRNCAKSEPARCP